MGRGREERNGTKQMYVCITEDSAQKQRTKNRPDAPEEEEQDGGMRSIIYQEELLFRRYKRVRCSCGIDEQTGTK